MADNLVVAAEGVSTTFGSRRAPVYAVQGVDLTLEQGRSVGIVGESGSGKTTLVRTLLGLTPASTGRIEIGGVDVRRTTRRDAKQLRRTAQLVHQDPHGALSPRLKVGSLLAEPYRIHRVDGGDQWSVDELLTRVGLDPEMAGKYPHELSGGQARRVGIARAIALRPRLLVTDEPTSGLDVSAAGEILNLLSTLSSELGISIMMVTHNLNTVGFAADDVCVMYLGSVVERGPVREVLQRPAHPYTEALRAAIPEADPDRPRAGGLAEGEAPSARKPPSGCRFHPRCPRVQELCAVERPALQPVTDERRSACHFAPDVYEDNRP